MINIKPMNIKASHGNQITYQQLYQTIKNSISPVIHSLKKILIIPPDFTRLHSQAGIITQIYYQLLKDNCEVHILPALGTHAPMTDSQISQMYGDIPKACFYIHNWREDITKIGRVPSEYISNISNGLMDRAIQIEVNKMLLDKSYDLILSIGQVVPHEVIGMANYSKNIFVGCGGLAMISSTHMLGAVYGMEAIMGRDFSPVRKVLDYAQSKYLSQLPLYYILTVIGNGEGAGLQGLYIGRERACFEQAVAHSQKENIILLNKPLKKVIAYLDEGEYTSTWLGNKAIYRTRMAIEDGGELIIIAPGVRRFGEDKQINTLIKKYGYIGREKILAAWQANKDLQENESAAAHLIHGSSEGRFRITYCTKYLSQKEVEGVGFCYMPYENAIKQYDLAALQEGINIIKNGPEENTQGQEIYFISNPGLGLWATKNRFI